MRHIAAALIASAALSVASAAASATTITFDALPGTTGDTFASYSEAGYTVVKLGDWKEAHAFGNPAPSVFVESFRDAPFGTLGVFKSGGGEFTFESLDLNLTEAGGYKIRGLLGGLGGVEQFSFASFPAGSPDFTTVVSTSSAKIDILVLDVGLGGAGSFNVDNIKVSAVPEPETYVFLAAGVGVIGLMARRRKARITA